MRSRMTHKLRLEMFVLVVDTCQGLAVEHAVVSAVVDARTSLDTHYVGSFITRFGESWEWEKSPGHSIWRQFVWGGTFEPDHALGLLVAVVVVVAVVVDICVPVKYQTILTNLLSQSSIGTLV